jgi:hypothetical protein
VGTSTEYLVFGPEIKRMVVDGCETIVRSTALPISSCGTGKDASQPMGRAPPCSLMGWSALMTAVAGCRCADGFGRPGRMDGRGSHGGTGGLVTWSVLVDVELDDVEVSGPGGLLERVAALSDPGRGTAGGTAWPGCW